MATFRIIDNQSLSEIGILDAPDAEHALQQEARVSGYHDVAEAEAVTQSHWRAERIRPFRTRDEEQSLLLWTDDQRVMDVVGSWTAKEACDADMVVDACRSLGFHGAVVAAPGLWGPYTI